MLTFALQCVNWILVGATALLCLRVAARPSGNPHHDAAWRLTGIAFLWHASDNALQNLFGGIAIAAGNSSPAMSAYIQWAPVMNHSRTFLLDGLMLGLVMLAVIRRAPDRRFWRIAMGLLVVGFTMGIVLGVVEGGFTQARHYSAVALWDVVELMTVFAAMFALLLTNRADRLLWGLLAAYGARLALGVFWFTLLAQLKLPGAWHPPAWSIHGERIFFSLVMLAAAAQRLAFQRRGRPVHGMLGRPIAQLSMMH